MTSTISRLYHDPYPDVTLTAVDELEIRFALPSGATEAEVVYWDKYKKEEQGIARLRVERWAEAGGMGFYRCVLRSRGQRVRYLHYIVVYKEGGRTFSLRATGMTEGEDVSDAFQFSYAGDRDAVHRPSWIADRVWYQIFPERFCNGDPALTPASAEPWGAVPTRENFFGGDLRGILNKIDYLERLGVNALYLNPIFAARSNHKYDTEDYFRIDPAFGTADELKELVNACHERGIKVVLDLVFNHCSYYHPFFQDVIRNGEQSPYRDWFYIHRFPVEFGEEGYDSVGYYKWMPKLRTSNPQVRQYIYDVVSFWQKEAGIDGWRIDVADEVEFRFLRELNSVVKQINKDSFIIAEIWFDAKTIMTVGGVDSAMNYELRNILLGYIADGRIDADSFHDRLVRLTHRYSLAEASQMFNLLGSHDTERIWTRCGEDKRKLDLLLALQYMMPGTPVVYYGDEAGMTGDNDPGCRGTMPWSPQLEDEDLWRETAQWIDLRKRHPALKLGGVTLNWHRKESVYVIGRRHVDSELRLLVNMSDQHRAESELLQACGGKASSAKAIRRSGFGRTRSEAIEPHGWLLIEITHTGGTTDEDTF